MLVQHLGNAPGDGMVVGDPHHQPAFSLHQSRHFVSLVMPGLVPGIHVFLFRLRRQGVDGWDKPGHDNN
jgi:hypothetical protein